MEEYHPALMLLIALNVLFSYKGFKDTVFFAKNSFEVDAILGRNDWQRLFKSGFLHVSWMHLGLNMFALYVFSDALIFQLGWLWFLAIYAFALIGGNLTALWFHRNHGSYTAVGASGAVSGVLFAAIILNPSLRIGLLFLPFQMAGWGFALLYVLYTLYGIQSQRDNIGHEAHLGGAIVGILAALYAVPDAFTDNISAVLATVLPISTFLFLIYMRPEILTIGSIFRKEKPNEFTKEHIYKAQKVKETLKIDDILDKINQKGIKALSKEERRMLDEYSKRK